MNPTPPRLATRFLRWYCAPDLLEEVQGDLEEVFIQHWQTRGPKAANRHYNWLVLRFFNYSTIRGRAPRSPYYTDFAMYRNYLLITLRQMMRQKVYAFINLFGLALGLATCLMVALFVHNEYRFDSFHSQSDQIYRLCEVQTWDGIIPQRVALSMYPMGPTLSEDYAQVEAYTRVNRWGQIALEHEGEKSYVEDLLWVDSSFLDMFDFKLLEGNPDIALDAPGSIILTETQARSLFGTVNVMGNALIFRPEPDMEIPLQVTGVAQDPPDHSHLQFNALLSLNTAPKEWDEQRMQNWGNNWLTTYLQLSPGANVAALEEEFPAYLQKYMGEDATDGYQLFLQRLDEVHLSSMEITHDYLNHRKFDGRYLQVFILLGLFMLAIATVNFTNLTTARSLQRAREVGVRKTIGATRIMLSRQFITEATLYAITGLILALAILAFSMPYLQQLSDRPLEISTLGELPWLLSIVGGIFLLGWIAGLYPAQVMSRFDPVRALKGNLFARNQRFSLQDLLVWGQFALAGLLIAGTMLTVRQFNYMTSFDPGFDREQVLLIPYNDQHIHDNFTSLRQELMALPGVNDVTASGQRLGNNIHQTGLSVRGTDTAAIGMAISHLQVDHHYVDFYNLRLLAGRAFDAGRKTDSLNAFVINEALVKKLGWTVEEAVGQRVSLWGEPEWSDPDAWGQVIGVVEDFHYNSLHHGINPLAMSVQGWWHSEISVKVDAEALPEVLDQVEAAWRATGTDRPYNYGFLDEHFEELYDDDQRLSQVVGLVATLALIVALMGLFGLMAFATERRRKEIGIRRVLGANLNEVFWLFARRVSVLVALALVVALPVAWWLMDQWLTGFAYRIELGGLWFGLSGIILMALALGTTGVIALRAASDDPAGSLRAE